MKKTCIIPSTVLCAILLSGCAHNDQIGVGVQAPSDAEVLLDGTRRMLDEKWTYWEGPRFSSELPIKWFLVEDPTEEGMVLNSNDPAALGGKYGTADIVTKRSTGTSGCTSSF
jgi:predicted small secreted protein